MSKLKRNILLVMGASMSLAASLALAACGGGETHTLTLHSAKEATCTEAGNEEYYSCSDCGKLFSDAEAKNEVTLDDVTIAATGHKPVEVAAQQPTCTEDGWIAHYECENGCGTYFSDAEGKNVIDRDDVIEPKLNHKNITETEADIDEEAGRGWIYHWACPDCGKYFADSFGDTELSEDEVFFDRLDSVTVTLTSIRDGVKSPITEGDAVLTGVDYDTTLSNSISTTLTLTNVYPIEYTISIENGDYSGNITFEEGKTEYSLELQYQWARDTSYTRDGYDKTSSVDLSQIGADDPVIIMSDSSGTTGHDSYAEATLVLPEEVKNSNKAAITFTVRWLEDTISYSNNFNALARFGVRMAEDEGVAICFIGEGNLQIFNLKDEDWVDPNSGAGGVFDGWSGDHNQYYNTAGNAAMGDGLQVMAVRSGSVIDLYLYLNNTWVYMASSSCSEDAPTEISLLVGAHKWEFSDIEYGSLEWVEALDPTEEEYGYEAHYAFGDILFDTDGKYITLDDIQILPTVTRDIPVAVTTIENGVTDAIVNGTIVLTRTDGTAVEGSVVNGQVTLEKVGNGNYSIVLTAEDGKVYVGSVTVSLEESSYAVTLAYEWAKDTSLGNTAVVDLSKMSDENHTIIMSEPGSVDTGKTGYAEATLVLPENVSGSTKATVEFTLKFSGGTNALTRFGVMMAERKGIYTGILTGDGNPLQICPMNPDNPLGIFDGWENQHNGYYDAVLGALQGDGLQVRMVRVDDTMTLYFYLDGAWLSMLSTSCGASAPTDIRFAIGGNAENVWEFSSISYYAGVPDHEHVLTAVPEKAATCTEDGNIAYYTCSVCGSFFADAEASVALTPGEVIVKASGHKLTYVAEQAPTDTAVGHLAYYECSVCNKLFLDEKGEQEVTEDDLILYPTQENVTLTGVSGVKDGATALLSGSITLTNESNEYTGTLTDGAATLSNIVWGSYSVEVVAENGDIYDGTLTIDGDAEYELTFAYRWATDTSTGDTAEVDLSKMNDKNHTITMSERYGAPDIWTGNTGVTNWAEATLNLPDAVKNSSFATIEFTLKLNADATIHAYTRFGVMMAEERGIFAAVMGSNNMQVCPINPDNSLGIFDGWSGDHNGYADAVIAALQGAGLQVRVVRDGAFITMYFNIGGEWLVMNSTECAADAQTDIRLVVGGNNTNVWEFSSIEYDNTAVGMTYHEEEVVDGYLIVAHYTDEQGNYYTEDRKTTTLTNLTYREYVTEGVTMENAVDYDLSKSDALYYEIYQQSNTTPNVIAKQDAADLIAFDPASISLPEDDPDNERGVALDGATKSHLKVSGDGSYGDITITVGSDADSIVVWTGAWLATVRVSLYDGETLVGSAEFEARWDLDAMATRNKMVTFGIDNSALHGDETKDYTLRFEYVNGCAGSGPARVRLAGIAVFGE